MTIGTLPPIGPIENICTRVTIPATVIAFCKSAVRSAPYPASAVRPHAPMMIRSGVRFPTNIAITCCNPSGIACFSGIRPSKVYGVPIAELFSFFIAFLLLL